MLCGAGMLLWHKSLAPSWHATCRVPRPQTVLLYGPSGTGKTLLANAVAHEAGATLFDLSPASTQGKYPGKEVAVMVHMVFKAARALAPSVVLVEDAEKVFISDKTRAKALAGGGEPCNRIKKHLLAEVGRELLRTVLWRTGNQRRDLVAGVANGHGGDVLPCWSSCVAAGS